MRTEGGALSGFASPERMSTPWQRKSYPKKFQILPGPSYPFEQFLTFCGSHVCCPNREQSVQAELRISNLFASGIIPHQMGETKAQTCVNACFRQLVRCEVLESIGGIALFFPSTPNCSKVWSEMFQVLVNSSSVWITTSKVQLDDG